MKSKEEKRRGGRIAKIVFCGLVAMDTEGGGEEDPSIEVWTVCLFVRGTEGTRPYMRGERSQWRLVAESRVMWSGIEGLEAKEELDR